MSLLSSAGVGPAAPDRVGLGQAEAPDEDGLDAVLDLVTGGPWFDFTCVRPEVLRRRVRRRMHQHPAGSMSEYLAMLQQHPGEVEALRAGLLAGGAWLFRDPGAWEFIAGQVLPAIVGDAGPSRPVRAWIPFCGTGAEAYSLAMLILEQVADHDGSVQLFASDVDDRSLELARVGRFAWMPTEVGEARLDRFFVRARHGYRVSTHLRRSVVFARHDLFTDVPFSHMDLICCRYVFMHLRPAARAVATKLLSQALDDGGYLILGAGERLENADGLFEAVSTRCSVYRRLERVGRTPTVRPAVDSSLASAPEVVATTRRAPAARTTDEDGRTAQLLRLVTMGNLAVSLAHELSQPLSAIANLLAACAARVEAGAARKELVELLREADAQSHRAGGLIAHVTRLLHTGERRLQSCDLRDLVTTGAELLRPSLRRHDIELRLALGETPLPGHVCRIEIEQVVVNLVQNAVDAIVGAQAPPRRIRVEASPTPDGHATIIVADTGGGVRDETADRMFEPFFTTKPDGLGMGLAICRSIVVAHGGRLWSDQRSGTTLMSFTLPLAHLERAEVSDP
jgi:chemotaxis methyl-accepting protein methylase/nitrogen-specific signal transduction histidine kinase